MLLTATAEATNWTKGPVLIGGDDMDDHLDAGIGFGGKYYIREGLFAMTARMTLEANW